MFFIGAPILEKVLHEQNMNENINTYENLTQGSSFEKHSVLITKVRLYM